MRKALLGILLAATFATPLAAQEVGSDGLTERYRRLGERNQQRYEQRIERREARQAERQSPVFQQRSLEERSARQQQRIERHHDNAVGADGLTERYRRLGERNQQRYERRLEPDHHVAGVSAQHVGSGNEHRELHRDYRREHRELHRDNPTRREHRRFHREVNREHRQVHRDTHRDLHRDYRQEHRDLHASDPTRREHRRFHRQVNRDHNRYHGNWDRGWRNDGRYDWQNYRYSNRRLYSPGSYYSPYRGLGYSRFGIGVTLGSGFYSNRYWINDPWSYRLPEPYPGTRWIRYYNDVLLVDTFSGEVVDVIYDFFW